MNFWCRIFGHKLVNTGRSYFPLAQAFCPRCRTLLVYKVGETWCVGPYTAEYDWWAAYDTPPEMRIRMPGQPGFL